MQSECGKWGVIRTEARTGHLPGICTFRKKLRLLGVASEKAGDALVSGIKVLPRVDRAQAVPFEAKRKAFVLLGGVACLYRLLQDGSRHIASIYFPGDFCHLQSLTGVSLENLELGALAGCTFGTIELNYLDDQLERHPSLGLALWRAGILELLVARTWLLNASQKPAVERVAHLICELLARQEASGMSNRSVLLNQLDIADAVGLSPVHVNRTIQTLRVAGVLSDIGRTMEVADREKLERIAGFDGAYLKIGQVASRWDVKLQLH